MEQQVPIGLLPLPPGLSNLDMERVAVMERYLPRASGSTDLVQWPVPAQYEDNSNLRSPTAGSSGPSSSSSNSSSTSPQMVLCDPVLSTLRSKNSMQEAFVLFVNSTPHTVRLLWVDYEGHEVAYDVLPAGHSCIQHTFATHPWVVREVKTATRLLINDQEAFCPGRVVVRRLQQQHAPAPAPAPAGLPPIAEAPAGQQQEGPQAGQQQQQQQGPQPQQQPERFFVIHALGGVRRVPSSALQRAEITELPPLAWSEVAHSHFPAPFKAAVRTFLLCHLKLQQSLDGTDHHDAEPHSPTAGSHLGHVPALLLPAVVAKAAPFAPQHLGLPLAMRADIKPTLLPEDPRPGDDEFGMGADDDWSDDDDGEEEEEEEEEQAGGNDDDEGDDVFLPLLGEGVAEEDPMDLDWLAGPAGDAAGLDGAGMHPGGEQQ